MRLTPKQTAYTLLRLAMGINLLGHGFARFSKLEKFKNWMVKLFKDAFIPSVVVSLWGSVLPFLEFGVGFLLIFGLFTYQASIIGNIIILILLFGSCLVENWEWAGIQMICAAFFYLLISNLKYNVLSGDNKLLKNEH